MDNSEEKMIFHLQKLLEAHVVDMKQLQGDIQQIKVDVALLKQKNTMLGRDKTERVKDVSIAGGLATFLSTLLHFLLEAFNKGGGQ